MMIASVIITGARAPVSHDLARAFRAAGVNVFLADCVAPFAASALRPRFPIKKFHSPRDSFSRFREDILELLEQTEADLLIPTCEEVYWLSATAELDGYAHKLFAPNLNALKKLHSKFEFIELAKQLGLSTPETELIESVDQLTPYHENLSKLVFKPEYSRFANHTLISPNLKALEKVKPSPQRKWLAQEKIEGQEYCSWALVKKGKISAYTAYFPKWRQGNAAAYSFESVDIPAIYEITEKVAGALNMTGHLSFDVIVDRCGRAHPIECNPRAISGLHLFDSTADLARAFIETAPQLRVKEGAKRHLSLAMLLLGVPTALVTGRAAEFRKDWRDGKDVLNRENNLGYIAATFADAARFTLSALKSRNSPAAATTADIEWDGEEIK